MKQKLFIKTFLLAIILIFSFSYTSAAYTSTNFDNFSFETTDFTNWDFNVITNAQPYGQAGDSSATATVVAGDSSDGSYYSRIYMELECSYYESVKVHVYIENDLNFIVKGGSVIKHDIYWDDLPDYSVKLFRLFRWKALDGKWYQPYTNVDGYCREQLSGPTYDWQVMDYPTDYMSNDGLGSWNTKEFTIPDCADFTGGGMDSSVKPQIRFSYATNGSLNPPFDYSGTYSEIEFRLDNFRIEEEVSYTLVNSLIAPLDTVNSGETFNVQVKVINDNNGAIVPNADVNFNFRSIGWFASEYNEATGYFEANVTAPISTGDYNLAVESFLTDFNSAYNEYSITVVRPEFTYLTITPIENIAGWSYGSVDFVPSDEADTIIWRVDSNSTGAETPNYNIVNSLTDGRQYFIYTSSDGINYPFDDTLTFGSGYDNPIQKLWNDLTNQYDYNFSDTLSALETKYYKLVYRNPYKYYNSITDSEDWFINFNPNVIDLNSVNYDSYPTSQYSAVRNIFKEYIPSITGGDTNSFEIQFTAWATESDTYICVGDIVFESEESQECEFLTTSPRRYSFGVNATDWDSQILIVSGNETDTADIINIMDYVIIPRNYFTNRLSLLKENGNVLNSLLLDNLSQQYLQEGENFRLKTGIYDREGVIDRLEIEGYFDNTTATNQISESYYYPYELEDNSNDFELEEEEKEETYLNFNRVFEPIIDLSAAWDDSPKVLILKANLFDTNGVNVSS